MLKLIVGLGNPGDKYVNNRHNAGYMILDSLPMLAGDSWNLNKKTCCYEIKKSDYVFAKPDSYVNTSGICVRKLLDFYKVTIDNLLVVHDDIDLAFGRILKKRNSGSAGHNGVSSIIEHCGSQDFWRVRVGVGRPNDKQGVVNHVLGDFTEEEKNLLLKQNFEEYVLF